MRQSYAHYVDKVQVLHEKTDKQKSRSKEVPAKASPRMANKLERNVLKLSGAEEAHDDYGRSLLVYVDEVTTTYWKDILPLLHMIMQFHINHGSDLAAVMAKLEKTDALLTKIGEDHGVGVSGRLGELKAGRPEVIDTPEHTINVEARLEVATEDRENDVKKDLVEEEKVDTLPKVSDDLESV